MANSLETHPLALSGVPCAREYRLKASSWPALIFARMIVPYNSTSPALRRLWCIHPKPPPRPSPASGGGGSACTRGRGSARKRGGGSARTRGRGKRLRAGEGEAPARGGGKIVGMADDEL